MEGTGGGTMPMMMTVGRNNAAAGMIIEDHIRKVLYKGTKKAISVKNDKLVPRMNHSAFGDFPKDYLPKTNALKKLLALKKLKETQKAEAEAKAKKFEPLKKGKGIGGKAVTLNPK